MKEFTSTICTNREQSYKLLSLGVLPETADMYLEKSNTPEYGEYHLHIIGSHIDPKHWFSVRMNKDIIPAWSLSRLLEIMPSLNENGKGFETKITQNLVSIRGCQLSGSHLLYMSAYSKDIGGTIFHDIVRTIEWLIKNNLFNKGYLNQSPNKCVMT